MIILKQGESALINVRVYDRENVPLELSTLTAIRASLFVKGSSVAKYADSVVLGYGTLEVDTTDTTSVNLIVTREQSKLFPIGGLTVSILCEIPDVVLTDKYYEYNTVVGNVQKGDMKNELIP